MCLSVTAANEVQDFDTAQTACTSGNGRLVPFSGSYQFETLRRYVQVLGEANRMYWVGYKYDLSGNPVDFNDRPLGSDTSAILTDSSNFGTGETAAADICVAIDNSGLLRNAPCSQPLPYFCANFYSSKSSVEITVQYLSALIEWYHHSSNRNSVAFLAKQPFCATSS